MSKTNRIGRMLADRYRIERLIGRGAMGAVYAATHTWMDRPVAIKLLDESLSSRSDSVRRFFQEARIAANVRHPNIVDVLDMGADDDDVPFIAMELLEGETLAAMLAREGKLPLDVAAHILVPLVDTLAVVHERAIVHRDLKPDNVFLANDFRGHAVPKLLDFGVAKLLEEEGISTRTGSVLGTPAYMAPEQLRGLKDVGPTADVWSMGVMLFRALAGALPIELGASPVEALMKIATSDVPSLAAKSPGTPRPVVEVVDGALRREAAERTGSMSELLDGLLAALSASGVSVRDPRL